MAYYKYVAVTGNKRKTFDTKPLALTHAQRYTLENNKATTVERHRHNDDGTVDVHRIIMYFRGRPGELNYIEY